MVQPAHCVRIGTTAGAPVCDGGPTAQLARFIAASADARLAGAVRHAACRAFANWLGCALGGKADASLEPVLRVALALGGNEQASVVGRGERLSVVNAALVNGVAANALDYDDMHVPTLIHPTGAVVAAAFALGEERHASGRLLSAAIVAGIEIECRLGIALFPAHYDAGWHITATLGTLGAAAAACVVLRLDAARTAHALGIAATQASGLRAMLPNACKSFNIGRAAASGVLAALLAQADLESAPDVLEAKSGLFAVFGPPLNGAALTRDLGAHYIVEQISLKPYPCGVVIHALVDACREIARGQKPDPGNIRTISIAVHPRALELAGNRHPETAITGRFSLYHAAALALAKGGAGLAVFDAADVNDPALARLRDCMDVRGDALLTPGQARVRLEFIDGKSIAHAIDHPSGSPARPLTDAQLHEKFIELAQRAVDGCAAQALFADCMALDRLTDVAQLRRHWDPQV